MKAFPMVSYIDGENGYIYKDSGMDLRDYFAAKAMQGMLSYGMSYADSIAESSYQFADAMMKARSK